MPNTRNACSLYTIKGLLHSAQIEILKKFNSFEVSLENLSQFLNTMSIASANGRNQINRISWRWLWNRFVKNMLMPLQFLIQRG